MKKLTKGRQFNIRCKSTSLCTGTSAPYPHWNEQWIPIQVEEEYPTYYVVTILPHKKPGFTFDVSWPYTVTIDKHDLKTGVWVVKDIRE